MFNTCVQRGQLQAEHAGAHQSGCRPATNLCAWLDALVDDSVVFSNHSNSTYELLHCFNEITVNLDTHVYGTQCIAQL